MAGLDYGEVWTGDRPWLGLTMVTFWLERLSAESQSELLMCKDG